MGTTRTIPGRAGAACSAAVLLDDRDRAARQPASIAAVIFRWGNAAPAIVAGLSVICARPARAHGSTSRATTIAIKRIFIGACVLDSRAAVRMS
jgi:hypothetical protein